MPNENLTQDNPVTHLEMGALPGAATNKSYKDSYRDKHQPGSQ
ncbi:hypothetical protein [uncultured Treponema sp.]|nr:hypothetical protein [uncultured Treponema sp.]